MLTTMTGISLEVTSINIHEVEILMSEFMVGVT